MKGSIILEMYNKESDLRGDYVNWGIKRAHIRV